MAGRHIIDRQVGRYMEGRKKGRIQAPLRRVLSERSGRRIGADPVLPTGGIESSVVARAREHQHA